MEFDRQNQLKVALDRRAEYLDLEEQIKKKRAEHQQIRATDDADVALAKHAAEMSVLEMRKNPLLPRINVEKNELRLEESEAKLKQLRTTFDLKRQAEQAEVRILEIQRDRAQTAMKNAEGNADRMLVRSPIPGIVVLRMNWRAGQMVEIQEGEEARPGMPIMLVVDPSAMLVRVKVNQADVHLMRVGQPARVSLDAYPELEFKGRVEQIAPAGTPSRLTEKVRNFVAIVSIQGNHPKLMPDLSAAVDVELERKDNVIVVPRDAVVGREGSLFGRRDGRGSDADPRRHTRADERPRSGGGVRSRTGHGRPAACLALTREESPDWSWAWWALSPSRARAVSSDVATRSTCRRHPSYAASSSTTSRCGAR